MSQIQINKCDKCGIEVRSDSEEFKTKNFLEITIEPTARGFYRNYKLQESFFYLCTTCLEKIGIVEIKKIDRQPEQLIGDKLYDIVADLVDDAIANK